MRIRFSVTLPACSLALFAMAHLIAQEPAGPPGGGAAQFPSRPPGDPASIARGKTAYGTNCAYCHGDDTRGGENGGTNLLRSDYVMKDKNGETLGPFLGTAGLAEHTFRFTPEQTADIAAFIHSFRLNSRDPGRMRPPTIVVGNAKAGEAYFKSHCGSCHSATGDLKGFAAKYPDARTLQQTWLLPVVSGGRGATVSSGPPVMVTVTMADGSKVEGRLGRIDDFIVTLTQTDGTPRSFRRDGDQPKIEVRDPMRPHKEMLPLYTDKDIHDVTAYLVTLK